MNSCEYKNQRGQLIMIKLQKQTRKHNLIGYYNYGFRERNLFLFIKIAMKIYQIQTKILNLLPK